MTSRFAEGDDVETGEYVLPAIDLERPHEGRVASELGAVIVGTLLVLFEGDASLAVPFQTQRDKGGGDLVDRQLQLPRAEGADRP